MCDTCGKSCICSWLTGRDQKTIEDRIDKLFGKDAYGEYSPEALAKMQAMKRDIALLRQMDLGRVLKAYNNQVNWDKVIDSYIYHYDTVDPNSINGAESNDVAFARTLITMAKIEEKYGPGKIDLIMNDIIAGNINGLEMFGDTAIYLQATVAIPIVGALLSAAGSGMDGLAVFTELKGTVVADRRFQILNIFFKAASNPTTLSVFPEVIPEKGPNDCYCDGGNPVTTTLFRPIIPFVRRFSDPLALDLDGDGIETVNENSGVLFDHNGDGLKTATGWIGSDDGLLVFDRNGDGVINNGGELFGDNTQLYDGSGTAGGAFEALAQEDTNGDGVVNALDDNWGSLKVWRDLNQDGISQTDELFTLDELGITGINTGFKNLRAYQ